MKFLISAVVIVGLLFQVSAKESLGRVIKVSPSFVDDVSGHLPSKKALPLTAVKNAINVVDGSQQEVVLEDLERLPNVSSSETENVTTNNTSDTALANPIDALFVNSENVTPEKLESGLFSFTLNKGLLKPQLYELLINHHALVNSPDDIHWICSDNFVWPNEFTVEGQTVDHVINSILAPYKLVAEFKGNGSVVIESI